jgi:hypothetical protein
MIALAVPPLPKRPGTICAVNFDGCGKLNVTISGVDARRSSPKLLWQAVDRILGRSKLPAGDTIDVEQFRAFFDENVNRIRDTTAGAHPPEFSASPAEVQLPAFSEVSANHITAFIGRLPSSNVSTEGYHGSLFAVHLDVGAVLAFTRRRQLPAGLVTFVHRSSLSAWLLARYGIIYSILTCFRRLSPASVRVFSRNSHTTRDIRHFSRR